MDEQEKRTVTMLVRVRPTAAEKFRAAAAAKDMSVSDAIRQAMAQWMVRQ